MKKDIKIQRLHEFRNRELKVLEVMERLRLMGESPEEFRNRFVPYLESVQGKGSIQGSMDEELEVILDEARQQCKQRGLLTHHEKLALEDEF